MTTAHGMFDLRGEVALVTGASRGIGRAIAERMAEYGAQVVVSSRKLDACEQVAQGINARFGAGRAIALAASVSHKDQLLELVQRTMDAFGRISVLVGNAASSPYYGPMSGITDEQFWRILNNNVMANHWLIDAVAPQMLERRAGSIVLISSIGALRGSPVLGAYNLSKAALLQLVRDRAVEYGGRNVRVNAIAPGLIKTDFARKLWDDPKEVGLFNATVPLARIGDPDEIAGAAIFLASRAGSFVTGETIVVDGGATISDGVIARAAV